MAEQLTTSQYRNLAYSYADAVKEELAREKAGLPNAWRYQLERLYEYALVLNACMDAVKMFERTQITFERLSEYHYRHDMDEYGSGVGWVEAISAAAEDIRAFDVPERVIKLHVARMRYLVGLPSEETPDLSTMSDEQLRQGLDNGTIPVEDIRKENDRRLAAAGITETIGGKPKPSGVRPVDEYTIEPKPWPAVGASDLTL